MAVIIKTEGELARWFRKNLAHFNYTKALIDPSGGIYPSFPDYWCIRATDGRVERVELETLSYNFYLHEHREDEVDRVICAENNCHLYGARPPKNLISLDWLVNSTQHPRCLLKVKEILESEGNSRKKQLFYTLVWRQPAGINSCFYCKKPIPIDNMNRICFSFAEYEKHLNCIEASMRYLSTLTAEDALRIQQEVQF